MNIVEREPAKSRSISSIQRRKSYIAQHYSVDWLRMAPEYGITSYHNQMMALLAQIKENVSSPKVLDCAAGSGFPFALEFCRRGWQLYTADLSETLVRAQRKQMRAEGGTPRCSVGDSESLPFADGSFGLTYCLQATWYFPRLEEALTEMWRVTSPTGVLVFDLMNAMSPRILLGHGLGRCLLAYRKLKGLLRGEKSNLVTVERASVPFRVEACLRNLGLKFRKIVPSAIPSLGGKNGNLGSRSPRFAPRLVYVCASGGWPGGGAILEGIGA